jgi:hypothetical protein
MRQKEEKKKMSSGGAAARKREWKSGGEFPSPFFIFFLPVFFA